MPITPTYPGVYVQEMPSGVRTITGVATSIGMFIGTSKQGPMGQPVQCLNYTDFTRNFSDDPSGGLLADYVRLFFLNGGTNCYVMRIADGASSSIVKLQNELGTPTLQLQANDEGLQGETIRAVVTYGGPQPEANFNIDLFRWSVDSAGRRTKTATESWKGLSMDPNSPTYAPTFLTQNSQLVDASDLGVAPAASGFSLSGRAVPNTGTFSNDWGPILGTTSKTNRFKISVNGSPYVDVDLSQVVMSTEANAVTDIKHFIEKAFTDQGILGITVNVSFPPIVAGGAMRLSIAPAAGGGDVFIRLGTQLGPQGDLTIPLMLGTAQGGLEVSAHADRRPAPNGITFRAADPANLNALADLTQVNVTSLTLDALNADGTFTGVAVNLQPAAPAPSVVTVTPAGSLVWQDAFAGSLTGNSDGVREKLAIIAALVNSFTPTPRTSPWQAQVWGSRLAILPADVLADNATSPSFAFTTSPALPGSPFTKNVHYYSLGAGGQNIGLQTSAGAPASDGGLPKATDYAAAYLVIDKEVDLFNLMVLSPDADVPVQSLYPNASVFCQQRRAVLLMDPPTTWTNVQQAAAGVAALRIGLVKDYSAVYFPRITIDRQGLNVNVGPAGAIAGLHARIDGTRGVWKAAAGTEATLLGVLGLEERLSDGENGVINPRGINAIRIFPDGIVSWGARTNDGDDDFASEYKYIPIRRLALYIEESLYRGLKWVVFEPNDEPLYAQIRLNAGSFMHNLFRQGAFQGQTPKDAYFVKCDKESTTDNDRNLGIVNIIAGFAPLKPAEFVLLYLQQMAGQIQV
jgi:phage tail sheath protein FI